MIHRSGSQLVDLLGLSVLDARVTGLLRELGVTTTPDGRQYTVAPDHGLRLLFKPAHQVRFAESFDVKSLVLSAVFFHSEGHEGYTAYAGELPYGLTFNLSVEAVQAILDPQAPEDLEWRNRWDFGREVCEVRFTDDGQGITLVTVGLPWSGVSQPTEPTPNRRQEAAVAMVDRLSARDGASRRDHDTGRSGELPPELVASRREQAEQATPFFANYELLDERAIKLSFHPPMAHHYLSGSLGAGYERFFDDVLWIGEDHTGAPIGYWKGEADSFIGAPVIRLDNEGSCQVAAPTLVDYYASVTSKATRPMLVDFCQRAGLPQPRTREQRQQAIAGLPDPDEVMTEFVRREAVHVRTNQPVRPLDRSPVLVALANGTVVAVSNEDDIAGRSFESNAAFVFDPTVRRFRTLPRTALRLSLHYGGAWALPDGRVVFAERSHDTYCVSFDPDTSTWLGGTPLETKHDRAGATVLADGRVLVVGGDEWPDRTARCDLYDPRGDQWSETGGLAVARSHPGLAPVAGGALAIGGWLPGPGRDGTDSCERYDAGRGTWTTAPPLPFPMRMPTVLVLRSGLILASGGEGWALYDPSRDAWTGSQRVEHLPRAAVELADNRVAFFGERPGYPPQTVSVLDVATADLTTAGTTRLPRHDSAAALLPDGTVLLVGGDLFHNLPKEPEIWDPATGRGEALPDLADILDRQVRNLATHLSTPDI